MTMTSQKKENWERLLTSFLEKRAYDKFEWGKNDCCTLACDMVLELTGEDPLEGWGRGYTTRHGAFKLLRNKYNVGFLNTFIKIFDEMGFEEVEDVQYGDVVFARLEMEDPDEQRRFGGATMALGFNDVGVIVAPSDNELILIEDYELIRAWRL